VLTFDPLDSHRARGGGELLGLHAEFRDHEVVLGTLAALQGQLHRVADVGAQRRVGVALSVQVNHLAVGHAGGQLDLVNHLLALARSGGNRLRCEGACDRSAQQRSNRQRNGCKKPGKHFEPHHFNRGATPRGFAIS
jgi:hypothetical protein